MPEETNNNAPNDSPAESQPGLTDKLEVKSVPAQGGDALAWFWHKYWWRNALMTAVYFAPKCYLAAGLWVSAGTIMVLGSWQCCLRMSGAGFTSLETYLTALAIIMSTMVITLVLMLISLGLWLICVTAYVRSFMQIDVDAEQPIDRQATVALQDLAVREVTNRKVYLARFWVYVTLFLLPSLAVLMISAGVEYLANSPQTTVVSIKLPSWLDLILIVATCVCTVLLTQLSLVAMAVCSISKREPFAAAKQSLELSLRWFVPGFFLTVLILLMNVVIASPQVVWQLLHHENLFAVKAEVVPMLLENFWQGITIIILLTFSGAPICQMLKGRIE